MVSSKVSYLIFLSLDVLTELIQRHSQVDRETPWWPMWAWMRAAHAPCDWSLGGICLWAGVVLENVLFFAIEQPFCAWSFNIPLPQQSKIWRPRSCITLSWSSSHSVHCVLDRHIHITAFLISMHGYWAFFKPHDVWWSWHDPYMLLNQNGCQKLATDLICPVLPVFQLQGVQTQSEVDIAASDKMRSRCLAESNPTA